MLPSSDILVDASNTLFSLLALIVSGVTAWLTLFRRGKVRMTRPKHLFFGWEKGPDGPSPKIFLRSLLFSTGERGRVVESMYLRVRREQRSTLFSFWAYGERNDLAPGSGFFVGREGVVFNHHFLPASDEPEFGFIAGVYTVEVYATVLNRKRPTKLAEVRLTLTESASAQMYNAGAGVLFDWNPDTQRYSFEIDPKGKLGTF